MSVNYSFGNKDAQITPCRAYKYCIYLTMHASPASTCFSVYKINSNSAYKNTKPFPGASNYTLHVFPEISKSPVSATFF